jgi:hypothetical protein
MMAEQSKELTLGDKMEDGTIFAGISPDTKRPMYVAAEDAGLTMSFNQAKEYAVKLGAHGHKDWRLPSKAELDMIYRNCEKGALKGTFNQAVSKNFAGWYWSSTLHDLLDVWEQRFSDGVQDSHYRVSNSSVRCVRG